jgi:hypothetical protein
MIFEAGAAQPSFCATNNAYHPRGFSSNKKTEF